MGIRYIHFIRFYCDKQSVMHDRLEKKYLCTQPKNIFMLKSNKYLNTVFIYRQFKFKFGLLILYIYVFKK